MKTKNYITKVRSQFKSSYYYLFWGAATVGVIAGQIYVGSGYRSMAKSMNRWFDEAVEILLDRQRSQPQIQERYEPLVPPPYGDFRDYGNGVVYL